MYHSLKSRTILMTSVCPRTIVHIIILPLKLNYMNIDIFVFIYNCSFAIGTRIFISLLNKETEMDMHKNSTVIKKHVHIFN